MPLIDELVKQGKIVESSTVNIAHSDVGRDTTGSFEAGLFFLSGCALVSAIVTLVAVRERRSRVEPAGVRMTPA